MTKVKDRDSIVGKITFDDHGQNVVPIITKYVIQDGKGRQRIRRWQAQAAQPEIGSSGWRRGCVCFPPAAHANPGHGCRAARPIRDERADARHDVCVSGGRFYPVLRRARRHQIFSRRRAHRRPFRAHSSALLALSAFATPSRRYRNRAPNVTQLSADPDTAAALVVQVSPSQMERALRAEGWL
jgi:hypothetical protein